MRIRRLVARGYRNLADLDREPPSPGLVLGPAASVTASYSGRKKRITINGEAVDRLADSVGHWLAVAFLPADVGLASGQRHPTQAVSRSGALTVGSALSAGADRLPVVEEGRVREQ